MFYKIGIIFLIFPFVYVLGASSNATEPPFVSYQKYKSVIMRLTNKKNSLNKCRMEKSSLQRDLGSCQSISRSTSTVPTISKCCQDLSSLQSSLDTCESNQSSHLEEINGLQEELKDERLALLELRPICTNLSFVNNSLQSCLDEKVSLQNEKIGLDTKLNVMKDFVSNCNQSVDLTNETMQELDSCVSNLTTCFDEKVSMESTVFNYNLLDGILKSVNNGAYVNEKDPVNSLSKFSTLFDENKVSTMAVTSNLKNCELELNNTNGLYSNMVTGYDSCKMENERLNSQFSKLNASFFDLKKKQSSLVSDKRLSDDEVSRAKENLELCQNSVSLMSSNLTDALQNVKDQDAIISSKNGKLQMLLTFESKVALHFICLFRKIGKERIRLYR